MLDNRRSVNEEIITILQKGEIDLQGRFVFGSNFTFLADVVFKELSIRAVYKPEKGMRPLWDFPDGTLGKRETAAFLVSSLLGWNVVPETVYRNDAPAGEGSLQVFIDHDSQYHYFDFDEADVQKLKVVVLFDLIVNNADRKGGHVIKDEAGRLWLIDHGLCFHHEDKLRTVIWDFAGQLIPENLLSDVSCFLDELQKPDVIHKLSEYITSTELFALQERTVSILKTKKFPDPDENRRMYPWPPV